MSEKDNRFQESITEIRAIEDRQSKERSDEHKREQLIINVARKLKIDKLRQEPGMDDVAVALNCDPTYQEKARAEYYIEVVFAELKKLE